MLHNRRSPSLIDTPMAHVHNPEVPAYEATLHTSSEWRAWLSGTREEAPSPEVPKSTHKYTPPANLRLHLLSITFLLLSSHFQLHLHTQEQEISAAKQAHMQQIVSDMKTKEQAVCGRGSVVSMCECVGEWVVLAIMSVGIM